MQGGMIIHWIIIPVMPAGMDKRTSFTLMLSDVMPSRCMAAKVQRRLTSLPAICEPTRDRYRTAVLLLIFEEKTLYKSPEQKP